MAEKRSSKTRRGGLVTVPAHPRATTDRSRPLTFPRDLFRPPTDQVTQYADQVTDRIVHMDHYAAMLGKSFGIPLTHWQLNETPVIDERNVFAAFATVLSYQPEFVSLERRKGTWGLYYFRGPAYIKHGDSAHVAPLKEAPLDARERFLQRSEEFFRAYLQTCEGRLGKMRSAVDAADRTIELLADINLE